MRGGAKAERSTMDGYELKLPDAVVEQIEADLRLAVEKDHIIERLRRKRANFDRRDVDRVNKLRKKSDDEEAKVQIIKGECEALLKETRYKLLAMFAEIRRLRKKQEHRKQFLKPKRLAGVGRDICKRTYWLKRKITSRYADRRKLDMTSMIGDRNNETV